MAKNTDDLWGDDFDEAEIEASILKASQMCPMLLEPPTCKKSNSTSHASSSRFVPAPLASSFTLKKNPTEAYSSNANLKIGTSNNTNNYSRTLPSGTIAAPTIGAALPKNAANTVVRSVGPLKVIDEAEQMEIDTLMEDPNIWDDSTFLDDPNVFDDQSPTKSSSNSQSQDGQNNSQNGKGSKANDDHNFNKFFDSFDGIDPDLLSSQPIPGTQPRQRWQKNTNSSNNKPNTANKYPVVASGIHSKSNNSIMNGQLNSSSNVEAGTSISAPPPSKFARTASGDRVNATIFNSMSSPTKGSLLQKQEQFESDSKGPSSTCASQFFRAKHPHASFARKPAISTSAINAVQKPAFTRRNSENLPSNKACHTQVGFSSKFPGATQAPSQLTSIHVAADPNKADHANEEGKEDLQNKLTLSEQMIAQLQKEIMTKKGEVSCLRSELQRKSMSLDAERMARLGAADKHKKEISEKVAAAALETQSKCRALEKRLEKLHSDMAFKSREISELTTKCKRLEQGQMQQQKRHQQQMQIYSQMVSSQEKQAPSSDQLQSPPKFLSPPPPPDSWGKNPLNESRRFPRSRFDFSKDGPKAGIRSLQFPSPKSLATCVTKASASTEPSLPKPQIPPASSTSGRQRFLEEDVVEDIIEEDDRSFLSDVHLATMFRKKGFYKAASESLSVLGDLSSTQRTLISESTEDILAYDVRHQLAAHLMASCPINDSIIFSEHLNLAYTSIVKVDRNENFDSLCERDEESNYTDKIVGGDLKCADIKPIALKRERLPKKCPDSSTRKGLENESKLDDFDSITQERASQRGVYCSANAYRKELETGQLCGEECPVIYQWNDSTLPVRNSCDENSSASSKPDEQQRKRSSWSVKRALKALDKTSKGLNVVETSTPVDLDVNAMPQEWARLLAAMSQDSCNRKFEKPLEEDILDDEMNGACDGNTAEEENNFIGFNCSDAQKACVSATFLERKRSAMMEKLGNFLYDLTQEMLEDNIRDLTLSRSREESKNIVTNKSSSKGGELSNKEDGSTAAAVQVNKNCRKMCGSNEEIGAFLLALESPSRSVKNFSEHMSSSRELFHCVLEWLAEEAAYYRNVEKKLIPIRCNSVSERHMRVMTTALIILKHLLPLRFSSHHLPPPLTVLAFLLYPLDITTDMALSSSTLLLACLQESATHPDSVMTPELAQLLVERLSRASHCASSPRDLTLLLRCLAALSSDRTFVQSLCSLADECLVWRLCLRLLDFCDVVLPNDSHNKRGNLEPDSRSSSNNPSLTVRQVVALMKTHSAATFYAVRNIVAGSLEAPGPHSHSCIKAFYRWMVSVLLAKPAWLFSDCHCNIVLLASLLVIVHSQVNTLVEGLPLIHEMKQLFCCHHRIMDNSNACNSIDSSMLRTSGAKSKSSNMKKEASSDCDVKGRSLVRISSSSTLCGGTTNNFDDSKSLYSTSAKDSFATTNPKNNPDATCSKEGVQLSQVQTPSFLRCTICNSPTLCSGHCHCCGLCSRIFNVNAFDIHSACECDCALVVSGLRVIKLYLTTDPRSSLQTAGIPSYTLLTKLLGSALPFFAPLLQSDASKLLARLP